MRGPRPRRPSRVRRRRRPRARRTPRRRGDPRGPRGRLVRAIRHRRGPRGGETRRRGWTRSRERRRHGTSSPRVFTKRTTQGALPRPRGRTPTPLRLRVDTTRQRRAPRRGRGRGREDEDDTARASRAFETSSKPSRRANSGSLTAAGASVIFARARGPSAEGDAALAFSPDFFAALGWAAGARGIAFGAAASSALSSTHAPVPIASSPHTLTSADFGASVGHVDILDETFKHDLLAERDGGVGFRDETEPTGTATSSYSSGASRATRQSRGPPRAVSSSRESASIQILRASFRCADLDRRGYVPAGALCALLGAAGGFDHLTLNAAAIFLASRLASLDRERGNITHVHEREDELTLADCARHLRAALRHGHARKTGTRSSSSRGSTRSSSRPDCRRVSSRFRRSRRDPRGRRRASTRLRAVLRRAR